MRSPARVMPTSRGCRGNRRHPRLPTGPSGWQALPPTQAGPPQPAGPATARRILEPNPEAKILVVRRVGRKRAGSVTGAGVAFRLGRNPACRAGAAVRGFPGRADPGAGRQPGGQPAPRPAGRGAGRHAQQARWQPPGRHTADRPHDEAQGKRPGSLAGDAGDQRGGLRPAATRWEAAGTGSATRSTPACGPTIHAMMVVGLVSLPGMMTGRILAGAAPAGAVRYQIAIMFSPSRRVRRRVPWARWPSPTGRRWAAAIA